MRAHYPAEPRPDLWWWDDFIVLTSGLPATSNTILWILNAAHSESEGLDIGDPDSMNVDAVWAQIDRARGVTPKRTSDWTAVRALDGRSRVQMVDGHVVTGTSTVDW